MKAFCTRFLLVCLCAVADSSLAKPIGPPQTPTPEVDERVELFSIVFRLAGNSEYRMNTLPAYSVDIDRHFSPHRDHPAVQMARTLAAKNEVGFDAVMEMAISISPPPALRPLVVFTATVPDKRWGTDAKNFLSLLRNFYRDSSFGRFYAAHQTMYRLAEDRFTTTLKAVNFDWYSRFYGKAPTLVYNVILGMNNGGGNYGPHLIYPDGRLELFSIIGCWTHDESGNPTYPPNNGYLSTIIHEFNHSFVNPAVSDHWTDFDGVDKVYATVADQMRKMAYGNAKTMVDESLVRAAVIVYFGQSGENGRTTNNIRREQRQGFFWMDRLVEKLEQYEKQRTRYPTFSSYIPQVALFYRKLAAHTPAEAKAFEEKSAHVVHMQPFANDAEDVDASIHTIRIVLDKRLTRKPDIPSTREWTVREITQLPASQHSKTAEHTFSCRWS